MLVNDLHIAYIKNMARELTYTVKKLVSLSEEQAARISEFRFSQRISSENEAIRQLIEIGLNAEAPDHAPAKTAEK